MKRKFEETTGIDRYKESATQVNLEHAINNAFYSVNNASLTALMKTLSNKELTMPECESLLRKLTICIKRQNQLSEDLSSALTALAFANLERLFQLAVDRKIDYWRRDRDQNKEQNIAFLLYNCGQLVDSKSTVPKLSAEALSFLLTCLNQLPTLQGKSISHCLYSLGLLAEAKKLDGDFDAQIIQSLCKKLPNSANLSSQGIANSLYGLGLLANANLLQGTIDVGTVQSLLEKILLSTDLKLINIGQCFYGLGLLARAAKFQGTINEKSIQSLLEKVLVLPDLDTYVIDNSFYGLGLLAEAGVLRGSIEIRSLLGKVQYLANLKSVHLSHSFYGLGLLAQAGRLQGTIDGQFVQSLLEKLLSLSDLKSINISQSFYGLGLLATAHKFQGAIEIPLTQRMFAKLLELPDLNPQGIANSFYGVGLLASAGAFPASTIDNQSIELLLEKFLCLSGLNAINLGQSLYGIGLLAKAGHLKGAIKAQLAQNLLEKLLLSPDLDSQAIGISFYGAGLLAKMGKFKGSFDAQSAQHLLEKLLLLPDLDIQAISNSFYGLGWLAQSHSLQGCIDIKLLSQCLEKVIGNTISVAESTQVLSGLSALKKNQHAVHYTKESFLSIKQLFATVIDGPYLHPAFAAELLNSLIAFKDDADEEFDALFNKLMPLLSVSLEQFPERLQKQLQENINTLETRPAWKKILQQALKNTSEEQPRVLALSQKEQAKKTSNSSQPTIVQRKGVSVSSSPQMTTPDPHWLKAIKNAIFKAIADRDETRLRSILHLAEKALAAPTATKTHQETSSSSSLSRDKKIYTLNSFNAIKLVNEFFAQTNSKSMQQLVERSAFRYFFLLLQACSPHARYQLAQSNALHPVLIHLPLDELRPFIASLDSPFTLYRDHKALFYVIDALTIRLRQNPDQSQAIRNLQQQLMDKALTFHRSCHHVHVMRSLENKQSKLRHVTQVLLDMVEEAIDIKITNQTHSNVEAIPQVPTEISHDESDSAKADSQTNSSAAPVEKVTPVSKQSAVNLSYQYETEDIQAILAARFHDNAKVHVLACAQLNSVGKGNSCAEILDGFLNSPANQAILKQVNTLLIPIQVPGHWVGLKVTIANAWIADLHYFNSLRDEGDNNRRATIKEQLVTQGLIPKGMKPPSVARCLQQNDSTSCGAVLIENFYGDITQRWWPCGEGTRLSTSTTTEIRERHLRVLREKRQDYYSRFQPRQAANQITVPAIANQLESHGVMKKTTKQRLFRELSNEGINTAEQSTKRY